MQTSNHCRAGVRSKALCSREFESRVYSLEIKFSLDQRSKRKIIIRWSRAEVLNRGYKAGGIYEMRRQNNGYFKLFAKNLFLMLLEIKNHFPKPFLTSAFLNNFLS